MKELINISGQQFYYSTIDQVIGRWSQKEKCAIIIDEYHLDQFLISGGNIIEESSQIIIISANVSNAINQLQGMNVLLVAAGSFKEAVKIAMLGVELAKKVICIPKENEETVVDIISNIAV